jgi:allophanate hydrolase subunit 1
MDQLSDQTAKPSETAKPVASRAGKDLLIGQIAEITNAVENLVVERVDTLINRLQNLKLKVILENKAAMQKFSVYLDDLDTGLQETKKLEDMVAGLERQQ